MYMNKLGKREREGEEKIISTHIYTCLFYTFGVPAKFNKLSINFVFNVSSLLATPPDTPTLCIAFTMCR